MSRYDVATDTLNPDYEPYKAGHALVGEATPQSHPQWFTDAEIRGEIKYLLRLNKKYGTHPLRVSAYAKLAVVLADRREARQNG